MIIEKNYKIKTIKIKTFEDMLKCNKIYDMDFPEKIIVRRKECWFSPNIYFKIGIGVLDDIIHRDNFENKIKKYELWGVLIYNGK
jgi:hypothetical protein